MSSTASPHPDGGLDVVVDPDGTLRVPAAELARHGVRPGSHLRIVTDQLKPASRRSARGSLTSTATADDINALLTSLNDTKSERIAISSSAGLKVGSHAVRAADDCDLPGDRLR